MSAAAQAAMDNMPTVGFDMLPVFERRQLEYSDRIQAQLARNMRLDDEIQRTKARLEEEQIARMKMGSPRSYLRNVGSNNIFKEMGIHNMRRIRVLEQDRDRAIKLHDQVKAKNDDLREEINELRKAAMSAKRRWKKLSVELQRVRDEMATALETANDVMEAHQEIKDTIEELKEDDAQEQQEFERECAALSNYITERLSRLAFLEEPGDHDALLQAELTPRASKTLNMSTSKLAMTMEMERQKDIQQQEKLLVYERAFGKLTQVTGISDIKKLVQNFIDVEDRNFGLFRYIQHVNKDVRRLQQSVNDIDNEIKAYNEQHRTVIETKEKMVAKLQRISAELRDELALFKDKSAQLATMRDAVCEQVGRLFRSAGCAQLAEDNPNDGEERPASRASRSSRPATNQRPRTGVPPHLADRPSSGASVRSAVHEVRSLLTSDVTEANVTKFMSVIEERVTDLTNQGRRELLGDEEKSDEEDTDAEEKPQSPVRIVAGPNIPTKQNDFHIVLPQLEDDEDRLDLTASLTHPVTNAMENSMKKLREDQSGVLEDNDALASLLPPTYSAEAQAAAARRAARLTQDDASTRLTPAAIIKELDVQFEGPDGLAVSQFIKKGKSCKPVEQVKGRGRRRKRNMSRTLGRSSSSASALDPSSPTWASSTAPAGFGNKSTSSRRRPSSRSMSTGKHSASTSRVRFG